jgi:hypothetical protein
MNNRQAFKQRKTIKDLEEDEGVLTINNPTLPNRTGSIPAFLRGKTPNQV